MKWGKRTTIVLGIGMIMGASGFGIIQASGLFPEPEVAKLRVSQPYFDSPHWVVSVRPATGRTLMIDGTMYVDSGPAEATQSASFPTTAAEAAALFAPGTSGRWESAVGGGWHLREEAYTTLVDPKGFALEGYYDTLPGRDPRQFVSVLPIGVQGATIWNDTPERLFCAMGWQKYGRSGIPYASWRDAIDAIGFAKPAVCSAP